jgi:predicted transcriptional regulator
MMWVSIGEIRIGRRLRPVNPVVVKYLKESIEADGFVKPIVVALGIEKRKGASNLPTYTLIAGLQRLVACQELGFTEIKAQIITKKDLDRRIEEIAENLREARLSHLERADHLAEFCALQARRKPAVMRIGDSDKYSGNLYVEARAVLGGASRSGIVTILRRSDTIDKKVKAFLALHRPDLANNTCELDRLVKMPKAQQFQTMNWLAAHPNGTIRQMTRAT